MKNKLDNIAKTLSNEKYSLFTYTAILENLVGAIITYILSKSVFYFDEKLGNVFFIVTLAFLALAFTAVIGKVLFFGLRKIRREIIWR